MFRISALGRQRRGLHVAFPIGLAMAALGFSQAHAQTTTCVLSSPVTSWRLGASGNWGKASNWTPGVVPNSASTNVCITDEGPSTVTLNVNATIKSLQLANGVTPTGGNSLVISPNTTLTVAGTQIIDGGAIDITAGGGQNAVLKITNNVTTFADPLHYFVPGAAITLSSGSGGGIAMINGAGYTLTNTGSFIQGAGVIGSDGMNFVNDWELLANTPGGELDVGSGGGSFTNGYFVEVAAGSTLKVTADTMGFNQIGGETQVYGELIVPHGFNNEATTTGVYNGKGVLEGTGTIVGNVYNDGIFAGALTIDGDLTMGSESETDVYVSSPGGPALFEINGMATLDGLLDATISGVDNGVAVRVMDFSGSTGDFTAVDYEGNNCTPDGKDLWQCAKGYLLEEKFVAGGLDLIPLGTPEPAAWAMMLVGLTAIGAALRCRRRGALST